MIDLPRISTFAREGDTVYHSSYARGTEFLMGYHAILDRAPQGREEGDQSMVWVGRHDEYDREGRAAAVSLEKETR